MTHHSHADHVSAADVVLASGSHPFPLAFYRELLDSLTDGVYFVDRDRRITYWNKGAEALSGYSASEAVGRFCRDNLLVHTDESGCNLCRDGCPLASVMGNGGAEEAYVYMRHREGHRVPVIVRAAAVRDAAGFIIGAVESFSENIAVNALGQVAALEKLAMIDPLTGIPNRRCIETVMRNRWHQLSRDRRPFGIVLIDIDHFKAVNDKHGHRAGDAVLCAVARTLGACTRDRDFVGRWGGEEFLCLSEAWDLDQVYIVAERCRCLVGQCAIPWNDTRIGPTISIGATIARPGSNPAEVIEQADRNLYAAKRRGRNCCELS